MRRGGIFNASGGHTALVRLEDVNGRTAENKISNGGIPFLFMVQLRYENRPDLFTDTPRKRAKKCC